MNESAFPTGDQRGHEPESGMTLRDYFAARVISAWLHCADSDDRDKIPNAAALAYEVADAMLKARESQEAPHTRRRSSSTRHRRRVGNAGEKQPEDHASAHVVALDARRRNRLSRRPRKDRSHLGSRRT